MTLYPCCPLDDEQPCPQAAEGGHDLPCEGPRCKPPTAPLSTLTAALDEIYLLRSQLAYEADVLNAHLDYKSFPKSRRTYAEMQVKRMREAARGVEVPIGHLSLRSARHSAGMSQLLTRSQWEAEKGIK